MASVKRTYGSATILAIGTANPTNYVLQTDYPDYYFRVTKSEHQTELKEKFRRMCEKSMIRKRHFHLTEEIIEKKPSIASYDASSLDARQDILTNEVPSLAKEAAKKAIDEWGQPETRITHLVFSAMAGVDMPGFDFQLIRLLGLKPSVKRIMMYHQGCYVGGTLLCIAKDIAESNPEARILLVSCDMSVGVFRGPSHGDLSCLVGQATVGDGAAALIIGSDPESLIERPIFQIISATQNIIPNSHDAVQGHLRETGLAIYISKDYSLLVSENIEQCLVEALSPIGVSDWNSLFWIVHPGGAPILNNIEAKAGLGPEKLAASRHVLSEYGNMGGPSVFFILDEIRKKSLEGKRSTSGEGMEWGVLFAYGAGIYLDTVVLRSVPLV